MKKRFVIFGLFSLYTLEATQYKTLRLLQDTTTLSNKKILADNQQKSLIDKIKEKELELQVPRETVPVELMKYPIKSSIPKTAEVLPFLQTLLHIELGTLPNPLGISVIGSFMDENYKVKRFNGRMGENLGGKLGSSLNTYLTSVQNGTAQLPSFGNPTIDGLIGAAIKSDGLLFGNTISLPILGQTFSKGLIWQGEKGKTAAQNREAFFTNLQEKLNQSFGNGQKEWILSEGSIKVRTSAVGFKADMWLFPFMQIFGSVAYLHMEQETNVGNATIPFDQPIVATDILTGSLQSSLPESFKQPMSSITIPVGTIRNVLDGFAAMGGTNLAIGYKGFFLSCMIAGGYAQLDDLVNNVKGFVQKPFMYIAPRIGYSLEGVMTAHFGVQKIELFGATKGKDLSASTGGLVQDYSVEIEKFPVNFLIGTSFTPMRDLGISVEYVISPDVRGLNAELAYRF
ncbi:hypothetical protein CQA62_05160 [Helicobacter cholecystus]|uniref:Uncharacterized protein n=2 Tax=Helicobacter cholecystus TaxID=45498 RepID=A0A3D8IUU8_9HELI|nr:hypothetical protein [Helicobacter cholecystus]RDU68780.1 hypothetical protein CQA62_05160 [Helicobacter cholecystus]VEJ23942.1 Uncharacterised protein [Helicobacter cholecystus]